MQVAAYRGEELIVDAWAGHRDLSGREAVDGDSLFNVFSVTKAVTATAVHIQAERGLIDYEAPLARYWSEFSGQGRERVTVAHVLTHRSGMTRMPADVTVEQICDWDFMVGALERAAPAFPPGTASGYQSMTFGWLLGEIVRRTDPTRRAFGRFVREEVAQPLGIADLWLGLPDSKQPRVAIMDDRAVTVPPPDSPYRQTTPLQVDLMADPYGRPEVRRACIPAVGGIFTARSQARFFAMLANGGALDGVRLLSPERVAMFSQNRPGFDDIDTFTGRSVPLGMGGFQLGGAASGSAYPPRNPRALCHPGMGGSFGYADPDSGIAMAFCHNRLSDFVGTEDDVRARVARSIERAVA